MFGERWERFRTSVARFFEFADGRSKRRNRNTTLLGEWLEPRQLLSANQITYDPTNQAIVIEGTAGEDQAQVVYINSGTVQATLTNATGTKSATFQVSAVSQVRFMGGDGDDRFYNATNIFALAWGDGGNDE